MNEIKVSTPTVAYEPARVIYDFTELDSEIVEVEKRYQNWLPSEDEIKDAEKVAKDINGVAANLNNEKIRVKKEMNAESKKFEDEVMERVNKLKGIRQSVLDNLDVYEQKRIKERTEAFRCYVEDYCKKVSFDVPYSIIFDTKVTNKSCTEKQWKEIAKASVDGHKLNFDLLCQMDVEDKELLQSIYTLKWDRLQAIDEYNAQMEAKKRADELRKQREQDNVCAHPIREVKEEVPFDLPPLPNEDKQQTNVSYIISVSGSKDIINKALEQMRNAGVVVEVL